MSIQIHAHETAQLQEARINPTGEARMWEWYMHDHISLEPAITLAFGKVIHCCR